MYDDKELFERALKTIETKKPKSITDLIAWMGISRETFYVKFPTESNSHKSIVEAICTEKAKIKGAMLQKWVGGNNATLQIAAYRLLADSDELRALSMQTQEIELPEDTEIKINIRKGNAD